MKSNRKLICTNCIILCTICAYTVHVSSECTMCGTVSSSIITLVMPLSSFPRQDKQRKRNPCIEMYGNNSTQDSPTLNVLESFHKKSFLVHRTFAKIIYPQGQLCWTPCPHIRTHVLEFAVDDLRRIIFVATVQNLLRHPRGLYKDRWLPAHLREDHGDALAVLPLQDVAHLVPDAHHRGGGVLGPLCQDGLHVLGYVGVDAPAEASVRRDGHH